MLHPWVAFLILPLLFAFLLMPVSVFQGISFDALMGTLPLGIPARSVYRQNRFRDFHRVMSDFR